jgi:hypothetical protein
MAVAIITPKTCVALATPLSFSLIDPQASQQPVLQLFNSDRRVRFEAAGPEKL